MLEQRVTKLEKDMGQISAVLERLEPKINEILLTGAKQADLQRTQLDVAELKGHMVALEEKLTGRILEVDARLSRSISEVASSVAMAEEKLSRRISEVDGRVAVTEEKLGGRISSVEGRMAGLEIRISHLPTIWTQVGLIFATWGIGSGIITFLLTRLAAR